MHKSWPFCEWNPSVTVDSPYKGPVMPSFDASLVVSLNKLLNKQFSYWWFEFKTTPLKCHVYILVGCTVPGHQSTHISTNPPLESNKRSVNISVTVIWTWWHYDMQMRSASPALCEGNPPVTGGFPSQRTCDAELCSFDVSLNKLLNKQ